MNNTNSTLMNNLRKNARVDTNDCIIKGTSEFNELENILHQTLDRFTEDGFKLKVKVSENNLVFAIYSYDFACDYDITEQFLRQLQKLSNLSVKQIKAISHLTDIYHSVTTINDISNIDNYCNVQKDACDCDVYLDNLLMIEPATMQNVWVSVSDCNIKNCYFDDNDDDILHNNIDIIISSVINNNTSIIECILNDYDCDIDDFDNLSAIVGLVFTEKFI